MWKYSNPDALVLACLFCPRKTDTTEHKNDKIIFVTWYSSTNCYWLWDWPWTDQKNQQFPECSENIEWRLTGNVWLFVQWVDISFCIRIIFNASSVSIKATTGYCISLKVHNIFFKYVF